MTRILITGGAGFVGANLATALAERHSDWELVALDNLYRPGSRLNLPRLDSAGVEFVEADVRDRDALGRIDPIDALIECSAEPSALVGMSGDTSYPFETNLVGAYNCLELVRRDDAQFVFLSTSRVYPYPALGDLALRDTATRLELEPEQAVPGAGPAGIAENFPLDGPRTLYGATKLAAELLVTEYAANFGVRAVVDRCGVIAGPWQMGKVDQGVFTFWLLHHYFGKPLSYIGYGGEGHQVRDLLHVADLVELIDEQLADPGRWAGFVGNVGGGREVSLSLARDDRDLPRADRQRGRDRAGRRGSARRRSAIHLRLLAPVRSHRLAPGQGGQRGTRRHLGLGRTEHRRRRQIPGAARMKLSVVVPAHNEAGSIAETLTATIDALEAAGIEHEILVIDDASVDGTPARRRGDRRRSSAGSLPALAPSPRLRVHGSLGARAVQRRRGRRDDGRRLR